MKVERFRRDQLNCELKAEKSVDCRVSYSTLCSTVEQAVVYSTLPQEYSTLTFREGVVAGGGGVEERSEVMYCIEENMYI